MGMNISRALAETHATAGEERALQAGIALARQHSAAAALAEASSVKALTSVLETNFASGLTSDILIGRVVSADLLRLQRLTVGIIALQGMNPLLEADQERRERLAELLNPCRGALAALRMQTSGLERVAEASNASLRRMAEACAPAQSVVCCCTATPDEPLALEMSEQLGDKETIFIDEAMTMGTHLVEPIYLEDCKADAL